MRWRRTGRRCWPVWLSRCRWHDVLGSSPVSAWCRADCPATCRFPPAADHSRSVPLLHTHQLYIRRTHRLAPWSQLQYISYESNDPVTGTFIDHASAEGNAIGRVRQSCVCSHAPPCPSTFDRHFTLAYWLLAVCEPRLSRVSEPRSYCQRVCVNCASDRYRRLQMGHCLIDSSPSLCLS